jgi:hypothetical protein
MEEDVNPDNLKLNSDVCHSFIELCSGASKCAKHCTRFASKHSLAEERRLYELQTIDKRDQAE